jgi:AraC-like DNA-binding protein
MEPLNSSVKGLSLLYFAFRMQKAGEFHVTKTSRNSVLIVLEGGLTIFPGNGEKFLKFTLLRGQYVWMPMAPLDFYFSLPEGEACCILELNYSSQLLKELKVRCPKGEKLDRFKRRWCGKEVLDTLDQLLLDPIDSRWSIPLYEAIQRVLPIKADKPSAYELPFIDKMFEVRSYLYQHYKEDINMSVLPKLAETNENKLRTALIEIFGSSASRYLEYKRIAESLILLKNKKRPLLKVLSRAVGFKSVQTFLRAFERQTGLTPDIWLKSFVFDRD